MSIMSSVFFILLWFTSMYAKSEARYIGLGRSYKGFRPLFPHPDKGHFLVVEKLRLEMDSSTKVSVLVKQDEDLAAEQKGTHGGAVVSSTTTTTKGMTDNARTSTTTKSDVVPDVMPHVSASWSVPHQIKNRDKIINHGDKSSGIMEYAGSEIFESSSSSSAHMGLHKDKATTATNKESRRRGLYAKDRQTDYEVEDGNDNGVVLEDYKPPHQTPPIHNKRT